TPCSSARLSANRGQKMSGRTFGNQVSSGPRASTSRLVPSSEMVKVIRFPSPSMCPGSDSKVRDRAPTSTTSTGLNIRSNWSPTCGLFGIPGIGKTPEKSASAILQHFSAIGRATIPQVEVVVLVVVIITRHIGRIHIACVRQVSPGHRRDTLRGNAYLRGERLTDSPAACIGCRILLGRVCPELTAQHL